MKQDNKTVQLSIKNVEKSIRDRIKIMAVQKGKNQGELLIEYIVAGLLADEKNLKNK